MSQQGDAHPSQEDDWWRQLYEEGAASGPSSGGSGRGRGGDSGGAVPGVDEGRGDALDAHFDSALNAMSPPPPPRAETMRLRRPVPPPAASWPRPTRAVPPRPRRASDPEDGAEAWDPWSSPPTFTERPPEPGPVPEPEPVREPGAVSEPEPEAGRDPEPVREPHPVQDAGPEPEAPDDDRTAGWDRLGANEARTAGADDDGTAGWDPGPVRERDAVPDAGPRSEWPGSDRTAGWDPWAAAPIYAGPGLAGEPARPATEDRPGEEPAGEAPADARRADLEDRRAAPGAPGPVFSDPWAAPPTFQGGAAAVTDAEAVRDPAERPPAHQPSPPPPAQPWDTWVTPRRPAPPAVAPSAPSSAESWYDAGTDEAAPTPTGPGAWPAPEPEPEPEPEFGSGTSEPDAAPLDRAADSEPQVPSAADGPGEREPRDESAPESSGAPAALDVPQHSEPEPQDSPHGDDARPGEAPTWVPWSVTDDDEPQTPVPGTGEPPGAEWTAPEAPRGEHSASATAPAQADDVHAACDANPTPAAGSGTGTAPADEPPVGEPYPAAPASATPAGRDPRPPLADQAPASEPGTVVASADEPLGGDPSAATQGRLPAGESRLSPADQGAAAGLSTATPPADDSLADDPSGPPLDRFPAGEPHSAAAPGSEGPSAGDDPRRLPADQGPDGDPTTAVTPGDEPLPGDPSAVPPDASYAAVASAPDAAPGTGGARFRDGEPPAVALSGFRLLGSEPYVAEGPAARRVPGEPYTVPVPPAPPAQRPPVGPVVSVEAPAAPSAPEPGGPGGPGGVTGLDAPGGVGHGDPGQGGETAFGMGDVRWAPELPPGWEAAGTPDETVGEPRVVGGGPPTYGAEPTAWPEADPDALDGLVPDTVLDGARYGRLTVRTASMRGDSARYRGRPRRDALLTARFGTGDEAILLVAMAGGARGSDDAHRAAQDAVRWIAGAVGRSRVRLVEDLRSSRRASLKSGLHRLTDRCYNRLRARGEDLGLGEGAYTASLRCLLLPADPGTRVRLFFGVGEGGLFRIRDGVWQDLDPLSAEPPGHAGAIGGATPAGPLGSVAAAGLTTPAGATDITRPDGEPPALPFLFRATVAQPGDALVMCTAGLAEPLCGEPELAAHLAARWGTGTAPGLAAYLSDAQTRVKGYADDRTVVTVWDTDE